MWARVLEGCDGVTKEQGDQAGGGGGLTVIFIHEGIHIYIYALDGIGNGGLSCYIYVFLVSVFWIE